MTTTMRTVWAALAALWLGLAAAGAQAQAQYGPNVGLEQARKAIAAAEAEARKNGWAMAISVVDTGGHLVAFARMDQTQIGSVAVATDKATAAALYRRPTKGFQDGIAAGGAGLRLFGLRGATPLEGGLPLVVDGKVVGAIGVSGAAGDQDSQCAKAGVDAVAAK